MPAPAAERISSVPPIRSARSSIDVSPSRRERMPSAAGSKPTPSSSISSSEPVAVAAEHDRDVARVGVLDRVLERLLGDAEHLEVARRIGRRLVLDRELDLEPFEAAHQPDVLAERPAEPVEREVERPELEHERAQLLERVLRERLQPLDLVARRGRIAVEQRPGRLGAEDEAEQLLAHRVVELEREAVALGDDGELARLLLEARVRDRDRRVRGEQPDQVVVLVAEVGRVELLGEVEGADHAVRGDDRDAEERPHVGMRLGPPAAELGVLVDVVRAVRRLRVEHRAEHAVLAGQRAE